VGRWDSYECSVKDFELWLSGVMEVSWLICTVLFAHKNVCSFRSYLCLMRAAPALLGLDQIEKMGYHNLKTKQIPQPSNHYKPPFNHDPEPLNRAKIPEPSTTIIFRKLRRPQGDEYSLAISWPPNKASPIPYFPRSYPHLSSAPLSLTTLFQPQYHPSPS
jgi:hypothetical protein